MTLICLERISFKIFETYLIEGIEIKYLFGDGKQVISSNRVPIELNIPKLNTLLFSMGLMKDIDTFFKILGVVASEKSPTIT